MLAQRITVAFHRSFSPPSESPRRVMQTLRRPFWLHLFHASSAAAVVLRGVGGFDNKAKDPAARFKHD